MDIFDELGPINVEIGGWLTSVIPPSWRSGVLEIQYVPLPEGEMGLAHKIRNPDGRPEPVSPPDEIYEASFRLYDLFVQAGRPWRRVEYLVTQTAQRDWELQATFEYPDSISWNGPGSECTFSAFSPDRLGKPGEDRSDLAQQQDIPTGFVEREVGAWKLNLLNYPNIKPQVVGSRRVAKRRLLGQNRVLTLRTP